MSTFSPLLRSRFRGANIPFPYSGTYLTPVADGVHTVQDLLRNQSPELGVETFVGYVKAGHVVRAEGHPDTSGKGLWLTGRQSTLVAAAVLQELLITESVESALYVDAFEYTDSKKPDRDPVYDDRIYCDLLVLTEVSRLSEWATGLVYQLTRERYWRGLPTLIADQRPLNTDAVFCGSLTQVTLKEV